MNKGESDVGAPSNITNGDDYEDERNEADYGYTYEYGEDYDYYDYDQDAKTNSLNERLGLFRSANKGNHLPSKVLSNIMELFRPDHFTEYFLKEFQGVDVTDEQIKEKEKMFSPQIKSFSFQLS